MITARHEGEKPTVQSELSTISLSGWVRLSVQKTVFLQKLQGL